MTGKKKLFKSITKHLEGLISKVVLNGSLERKKNRERVLSRISSKGKTDSAPFCESIASLPVLEISYKSLKTTFV